MKIIRSPRTTSIDDLPFEVLHMILDRLPHRDAIRTSRVSRQWSRVVYSYTPRDIVLDEANLLPRTGFQSNCRKGLRTLIDDEVLLRSINGLIAFLVKNRKSGESLERVDSMTISACLHSDFTEDVDAWVRFGIKVGVDTLVISPYSCFRRCYDCDTCRDNWLEERFHTYYKIREDVLEGNGIRHLELHGCRIDLTFFEKGETLKALKKLYLQYSKLVDDDSKRMFRGLKHLERFTLEACFLPKILRLGYLISLQKFRSGDCRGLKEIMLERGNPNLIKIKNHLGIVVLDLRRAPNLKIYNTMVQHNGLTSIFTDLPRDLPKLQPLSVHSFDNWPDSIPDTVPTFRNVSFLELHFIEELPFDYSKMLMMLNAFPDIQHLTVEDAEVENLEFSYDFKHLKEALIVGFAPTQDQMYFVSYMVLHSPVLEILDFRRSLHGAEDLWNEEALQWLRQLLDDRGDVEILVSDVPAGYWSRNSDKRVQHLCVLHLGEADKCAELAPSSISVYRLL